MFAGIFYSSPCLGTGKKIEADVEMWQELFSHTVSGKIVWTVLYDGSYIAGVPGRYMVISKRHKLERNRKCIEIIFRPVKGAAGGIQSFHAANDPNAEKLIKHLKIQRDAYEDLDRRSKDGKAVAIIQGAW